MVQGKIYTPGRRAIGKYTPLEGGPLENIHPWKAGHWKNVKRPPSVRGQKPVSAALEPGQNLQHKFNIHASNNWAVYAPDSVNLAPEKLKTSKLRAGEIWPDIL